MPKRSTDATRKEQLLKEFRELHATVKALTKDFKTIQKKAKNLAKKIHETRDDAKEQAIRKRIMGKG
jgi:predicted transcriptional regulator